jgi:hypothetical protein
MMPRLMGDNSCGGLTVEAAVVFPAFLVFMLAIVNFINTAVIYISMDHAVGETVKLVAAYSYPLKYINTNPPKLIEHELVNELFGAALKKGAGAALDSGVAAIARKKVIEMYPLGQIDEEDFRVIGMRIYNPARPDQGLRTINGVALNKEDIALVVEYEVPLTVPFGAPKIRFSSTAVERAWVD